MTDQSFFTVSEEQGTTESERLLSKLCRQSFLSLWTFPNVFTDEGRKAGKGAGKEFADVLLLFGNEVAIFSDKHITFDSDADVNVAWRRWYRRAVQKSVNQLHGAESWIRRFSNRLFLDSACEKKLPISIEDITTAKIHLVAVTRGSFHACREYFGEAIGSHFIHTGIADMELENAPFVVGRVGAPKHFVHVFDEFSLELALRELDTTRDFLDYLEERERLLSMSGVEVMAAGEEQLISFYLTHMRVGKHTLTPDDFPPEGNGTVAFDGSHFEGLLRNEAYRRKKKADAVSYLWDRLIEKFVRLGTVDAVDNALKQAPEQVEVALRVLAAESRFRRRTLAENLSEFHSQMHKRERSARGARIIRDPSDPTLIYVFLMLPKGEESYAEYRNYRAAIAQAYCLVCRAKYADSWRVVCIAFDHPKKTYEGGSEDLLMFEARTLSDDLINRAELARAELGILREKLQEMPRYQDEFPPPPEPQSVQAGRISGKRASDKKKRKRKIAAYSRKRNRKS